MPDRTICQRCGRVGFVRRERVFKGGSAKTEFYCGHCLHTWTVRDEERLRATDIPRD